MTMEYVYAAIHLYYRSNQSCILPTPHLTMGQTVLIHSLTSFQLDDSLHVHLLDTNNKAIKLYQSCTVYLCIRMCISQVDCTFDLSSWLCRKEMVETALKCRIFSIFSISGALSHRSTNVRFDLLTLSCCQGLIAEFTHIFPFSTHSNAFFLCSLYLCATSISLISL